MDTLPVLETEDATTSTPADGGSQPSAVGPTIAVWAHINGVNQGDDLVVETVISGLRERLPNASLVTVSMYPPGSEQRHGVPSHGIGAAGPSHHPGGSDASRRRAIGHALQRVRNEARAIAAAFGFLRNVDVLVIAGSGPLEDDRGSAYRLAKWVVSARLAGGRVLMLSVGAGPLEGPINRRLVRLSLRLADYVSVRDNSSASLLADIGYRGDVRVRPDMGWAWQPLQNLSSADDSAQDSRPIGVNVMGFVDSRNSSGKTGEDIRATFDAYRERMVSFLETVLASGRDVVLFSTETAGDIEVNLAVREELHRRGHGDIDRVRVVDDSDIETVLSEIRNCSCVVATRFHAVILALASGVPTIGLAYHPKTRDLFEVFELPEFGLDSRTFTAEQLMTAVDEAAERATSLHNELAERARTLRATVESQFDEAARLVLDHGAD